jgi:hypothetical protein
MNRLHNRTNYTGEEMDLSHLIDSGINGNSNNGNSNNNTPNNNSSVKTNSTSNARSNVAIPPNSNASNSNARSNVTVPQISNVSNRNASNSNVSNISDNNDPIATFLKDPNKVSRNLQNEKAKAENKFKKERTPQEPLSRSDVPEVKGKTTAFIPYKNKDGSITFQSFTIKTKTATNMTVEHITPPYVNQSNKKNNVQ